MGFTLLFSAMMALDSQGLVPRDYFERYLSDLVQNEEISEEDMTKALDRVPL